MLEGIIIFASFPIQWVTSEQTSVYEVRIANSNATYLLWFATSPANI